MVTTLQILHALAGFIALAVAPLAMLARKGGDWHRRWGKAYFYSMVLVAATAIALGIHRSNWLMAMVAVFAFHMIASGYRALYLKRLHEGQRPQRADLILMGSAGIINGGLFLWGAVNLALGHRGSGPVIFTVFGIIGLLFVWRDLQRFYRSSHDKRDWLYAHMTGFLGGYIATVSAFSAVNLTMIQPQWVQWIWPTVIGAPLIAAWVGRYRRRFDAGGRSRDLFELRIGRGPRKRREA